MTRDDIIRLARESGIGDTGVRGDFIFFQPGTNGLERFAALVAEREREECAKVCEGEAAKLEQWHPHEARAAGVCASAIRARGEI